MARIGRAVVMPIRLAAEGMAPGPPGRVGSVWRVASVPRLSLETGNGDAARTGNGDGTE